MASPTNERVRRHREQMRAAGMRPLQIWVPDVNAPGFAEEAHRQSVLVAQSAHAEDDQRFVDEVSDWGEE